MNFIILKKFALGSLGIAFGLTLFASDIQISKAGQTQPALEKPGASKPAANPITLVLVSERKVIQRDELGRPKTLWKQTAPNTKINPGDVIRYTVVTHNVSDRPISNLAVTQPVPSGTIYTLDSAATEGSGKVETLYSIDGGKSYSGKPKVAVTLADGKIEVRNAPAEAYTHIRWRFENAVAPDFACKLSYRIHVR